MPRRHTLTIDGFGGPIAGRYNALGFTACVGAGTEGFRAVWSPSPAAGHVLKGVATVSKIVQIIPAVGWCASFRDEFYQSRGDERPLVAWALLEDGSVCGLVADDTSQPKLVTEFSAPFLHYANHSTAKSLA